MLRKSLKIAAWTGAGIVAVLVLAVGALVIALWTGPIDASFLAPRIETALAPADGSFRIRSKATRIAWEGWSRGIRVQVTDVAAIRRDGTELARFPRLSVQLRIGSLLGGRFSVTRIALHEPHIRLERDANGRLNLGITKRATGSDPIGPRFIRALANRTGGNGTIGALESIEVVSGTLTITDPTLGRSWQTRNLNGELDRDAKGISGKLSFDLAIKERLVHFAARASYNRATKETQLRLRFKGLDPALFASARGAMAALTWVNVPLSGAGTLDITGGGRIRHASLDFTGGRGVINIPGIYKHPLPVKTIKLVGEMTGDGRILTINTFDADLGIAKLSAKGVFRGSARDFGFAGKVAVSRFPARELDRLWPDGVESKSKVWVTTNIRKGTIDKLRVAVRLHKTQAPGSLSIDKVDGTFDYTGLRVIYYKHLPPVTDVSGSARFDTKALYFTVTRGRTVGIDVGKTNIAITGFDQPKQALAVTSRVRGPMAAILSVLDRPPLKFAQKLGVSPPAIKGRATGTLKVGMMLLKTLTINDVDISAKAKIAKLFWRKGLFGLDVAKGGFTLTVDKAGMRMAGKADLSGEYARIDWREKFGETDGPRRAFDIQTVFDPEVLARTGLDIRKIMSGKFGAKLQIKGYDDGRNTIAGTYDFKHARFVVPILSIEKPTGMPAQGRSRIELKNQRIVAVPHFSLNAPVLKAEGRARFYGDGVTIRELRITRLTAGLTDLSATIRGTAKGAKTVTLNGKALDLRPLMKAADAPPDKTKPVPPTRVVANVKRAYFGPGRYVTGVKGKLHYDGARWRAIDVRGHVGAKAAPFAIDYAAGPRGRTLKAWATDAGAALRALNVVDEIRGGTLEITGAERGGSKARGMSGNVKLTDFRVSKAPAMARLLALASQQGLANWASSDKGIEFRDFTARFRAINGIVYLRDARAVGSQVGFTFAGALDLNNESAKLTGTVIPLYSLNSVIGKVPVIGRVLMGGKGGGLFAVRYSVNGPLKNPQIAVNPLSILTPGIMRKIFDLGDRAPRPEDEKPTGKDVLKQDKRYER